MDGKMSEQRVYCKIRAQLRFLTTEKVYGNVALKCATVYSRYVVLMMVGSQLKMTLGWEGRFPF